MKRFRLNTALLLFGIIVATATATYLFTKGFWAQGCFLVIFPVTICIALIWHLQTRLIDTMSTFVSALEMNDTTLRVELGGDDDLKKMSESMNRISILYHDNIRELQTSKLYYDRVLRIMTHEMRNGITPIAAITADMIKNPGRYNGIKLSESSQLLNGQAEGIRRLLDSYHTLTHLPKLNRVNVDALDYFSKIKQLVKGELEKRNLQENIVRYTVPKHMNLNIDISLMNQVMINLIRNSLDSIAITERRENGEVEIVLTISNSKPCITVKDNGCGMTEEIMDNLFQPFYTTKEHGTGVGLSICRQIIRLHGGEIRIQSILEKGTSVIITL